MNLYSNEEQIKLFNLNDEIDNLIDIAHDSYMSAETDEEKTILDGRIKAYWDWKSQVENILADFYGKGSD